MTITIIAEIIEMLDELRSARQAAAAYEEWKRDPTTARPWDEVDAELSAGER